MAQLWYDVIAHGNGWAIAVTPSRTDSFPTKKAAYDAAVEYARKLRFVGYAVQVRVDPKPEPKRTRGRRPREPATPHGLISATA